MAMKDANDLDPQIGYPIEDEIPPDDNTTGTRTQIVASLSGEWVIQQEPPPRT